jgi:pimeloyl-ACP methyl ester carboxylesterase
MQGTGPSENLVPGGGRDLAALKEEVQRRTDRNMPPLTGISSDDAREALARIDTLDRDAWAAAWFGAGDRRWERARSLDAKNLADVRDEYWKAWRLFHFARWPTENSPTRQRAKHRALQAFQAYARLLDPPMEIVRIPFEGKQIVGYLRLPPKPRPAPLVLGIAGLDSRKEDIAAHSDNYLQRGMGLFAIDLPGTGESPLAAAELNADRIFSEVLDYLEKRQDVDSERVLVQGRSWSGYWAAKLAITERARLRGTVMHGGPIHHYFQPEKLRASLSTGEYLYDYLAAKSALVGAASLEEMIERMSRFDLLATGILDEPSAPMLCVNGARDSQVPIADIYVLLEHGDPKEAWINPAGGHMGRSPEWPSAAIAEKVVLPWIARRLERRQ